MRFTPIAFSVAVLALSACGGGGDSSTSGPGTNPPATNPPATPSAVLSGTAATGSALANANVAITDGAGNAACQESSITTTALGSYTCTLKAGEAAPFFVVVTDPTGNTPALVSVATTTPAAGATLTVNATPLTTAIVAQLSSDGNAMSVVNSKQVDAATLQQVVTNVLAQLSQVLSAIGASADYNPFSTSIVAATASGVGNTADQLLDIVKVVTNPATGKLALATVDNPTPVDLATASSSGTPLAKPADGVASLPQGAQLMAKALNACFAIPTAQRVLSTDTTVPASAGGPDITSAAAACQDIAADSSNAAHVDFLHNGYSSGQFFYGLLTSDAMNGAQFSMPEIMAFYPAASSSDTDRAVVNIRYLDANGNPGNIITVAQNISNSSTAERPTTWWLVGNQHSADVSIRLQVRRVEQLNPSFSATDNRMSTFQTGISVNANARGPGSVSGQDTLQLVRVSGPGLPGNGNPGTGLVYTAAVPQNQSTMDLLNKAGVIDSTNNAFGARCGNGTTYNCPNLWFARTAGISGAAATTLTTNPANSSWVQQNDGADPKLVVKGARYKVELFYGSDPAHITNPTNPVVFHKTLLSDLVQAGQAVNLPWNTPGQQTFRALDPNGGLTGAQASLPVDWAQNAAAQQIGGVQFVTDSAGSFGPMQPVARGATSLTLNSVPAFSAAGNGRTFLFSYRMLDSSAKTAVYRFN